MHRRYVTKTVHVQCCQRTTDLRCANPWHANVNYKWLCIASACTAVFVCHAAPCTHKNRHNNDSKIPVQIRHLSCHQNVLPKSANLFRNTVTVQRQLNNEKLIKYATKTPSSITTTTLPVTVLASARLGDITFERQLWTFGRRMKGSG